MNGKYYFHYDSYVCMYMHICVSLFIIKDGNTIASHFFPDLTFHANGFHYLKLYIKNVNVDRHH